MVAVVPVMAEVVMAEHVDVVMAEAEEIIVVINVVVKWIIIAEDEKFKKNLI